MVSARCPTGPAPAALATLEAGSSTAAAHTLDLTPTGLKECLVLVTSARATAGLAVYSRLSGRGIREKFRPYPEEPR